ncbi:hypothetical protein R1sor_024709 [Riccia sorocarpa]|uniref:Uncharacterized protein n=1 Tax=Riccia sorocarpa TaxID=122646 RepID=A0ABD3GRA1_9MARC
MKTSEEARSLAERLIAEWCEEKGTDIFRTHLLQLLDIEYLRTWPGLSHIAFPKRKDRLSDGTIPNKHWRYRFYHGCAAVLGWTERVTYGDERYFGPELHEAIKSLWPDETRPVRPLNFHGGHPVPIILKSGGGCHLGVINNEPSRSIKSEPSRRSLILLLRMAPQKNDLEREVANLLQLPCPAEVVLSAVMPRRKTRVVSTSSARRIILNTPLKSPIRICMRSSPGCIPPKFQDSARPASQLLSIFQDSVEPESATQDGGWSLRRQKGLARKGIQQFKRPGRIPAPLPNVNEGETFNDGGSSDDQEALPQAAPKPGRFPPPSIRQSRQTAPGVNASSTLSKIIGVEKDVFTDVDLLGSIDCDEQYLCVYLLHEHVDEFSGLSRVSVRLPHSGKIVDTFHSCCNFDSKFIMCTNHSGQEPPANVNEHVISAEAKELLAGTILSAAFESGSESEWYSEADEESGPIPADTGANDSEAESYWEDYQDEILEEDLPRLGVTKTDDDFLSDPLEWQLADENWPSANTSFSHNCKGKITNFRQISPSVTERRRKQKDPSVGL